MGIVIILAIFLFPLLLHAQNESPNRISLETARAFARSMSDDELAGQVIMTGIDAAGTLKNWEKERLRLIRPGAIILFGKNIPLEKNTDKNTALNESALRAVNYAAAEAASIEVFEYNAVQKSKDRTGRLLPFIACDQEGGDVQRIKTGDAALPSPLFYEALAKEAGMEAALKKIENDAEKSARALLKLGITMNLAPVAEILNSENSIFLDKRAFGRDGDWAAAASCAFIRGMERGGLASVVKHFPGNSSIDPHKELPIIRLNEQELLASLSAIYTAIDRAFPAGVMVTHSIAAAWDSRPASLSPLVLRAKLSQRAQFSAIIIADDFSMGAIAESLNMEDASVMALAAGVDMVMAWPSNLNAIHNTIKRALQTGRLQRARLEEAAGRIIFQKARFGLLINN